jgi:hypothetical protein
LFGRLIVTSSLAGIVSAFGSNAMSIEVTVSSPAAAPEFAAAGDAGFAAAAVAPLGRGGEAAGLALLAALVGVAAGFVTVG